MTERKSFLAFAVMGLMATAAFGYRAVAQTAEEGGEQANEQGQMMMQCPMMEALKSVQLHADSPAVLLGQEQSLDLTAQQQEQLKEIAAARQQARDVLSDKQRQQLEEAPSGPLSPMQLAKLQRTDKAGDDSEGQMCPMCMKMKDHQAGEQGNDGQR